MKSAFLGATCRALRCSSCASRSRRSLARSDASSEYPSPRFGSNSILRSSRLIAFSVRPRLLSIKGRTRVRREERRMSDSALRRNRQLVHDSRQREPDTRGRQVAARDASPEQICQIEEGFCMEWIDADHFLEVHFSFSSVSQDGSQIIVGTFMLWPQAVPPADEDEESSQKSVV